MSTQQSPADLEPSLTAAVSLTELPGITPAVCDTLIANRIVDIRQLSLFGPAKRRATLGLLNERGVSLPSSALRTLTAVGAALTACADRRLPLDTGTETYRICDACEYIFSESSLSRYRAGTRMWDAIGLLADRPAYVCPDCKQMHLRRLP